MSKKRRMFDIDLPEDEAPQPIAATPATPGGLRRGPMATAIGENADSLRHRQEQEALIRDENDALAHEFVRLKKLGLVTDLIPIDAVQSTKLTRDRSQRLDPDISDLKASILAIGLSNPIQIEPTSDGAYELVQGWRRLSAYRALFAETGDARFGLIPAAILAKGESLQDLYRRMVDENMVRKDISWAEMAILARSYADDPSVGCADLDTAVNVLFATASPQKRSYIRRFAQLMAHLGEDLRYAEAIPRALGLELSHKLEAEEGAAAALMAMLRKGDVRSAEDELSILRQFAESRPRISPQGKAGRGRPARRGKTTLRLPLTVGEVRCTAAAGKVEMHLDRDFSTVDRAKLEAAVEAFFNALD